MTDTQDRHRLASFLQLEGDIDQLTDVQISDQIKKGLRESVYQAFLSLVIDAHSAENVLTYFPSSLGFLRHPFKKTSFLSPSESEVLYRAVSTWFLADSIYHDDHKTLQFLNTPHAMLEGRRPLRLAMDSEVGHKAVEQVLLGLKYGTAA